MIFVVFIFRKIDAAKLQRIHDVGRVLDFLLSFQRVNVSKNARSKRDEKLI